MDSRRPFSPESASVLVALILMAFIGFGYVLLNWADWAPAGAGATVAPRPAIAEPGRSIEQAKRLAFPLAGLEHALRDNFDEKRGLRRHDALDIMAPRGTPVRAVDGGRIAKLYRGPLAGISIYQFDSAATRVYLYAHLDGYASGLAEGQVVKRGEVIGYVGSTGNAPRHAPHLHFAIHELGGDKRWWKGKPINPYPLLRPPA